MEFEDHEDQEEEMALPVSTSYDSLGNSPRPNIPSPVGSVASLGLGRKAANRYRECLKNHAVSIGGNAVDGCGEFMANGEEGTLDALKCAACNCHRSFHRKDTEGEAFHPQFLPYNRTSAGYPHHRPLALPSTSAGGGQSREEHEDVWSPSGGSKKRFRTKFSQEQKEKMVAFAERIGWRIQKHDEAAVQQFCTETCVKRQVLRVWMHNNKHTLGMKP